MLGALTFCCGGSFVWFPFTLIGGKQVTRLHERLKPGMSVAEVLRQVDETGLWSLGLSHVFAFGEECSVATTTLVWSSKRGAPWNNGANQTLEDSAKRLASCERIAFRLVVLVTRFHFVVTLKDGRVSEVGPAEGQFE